MLVRTGTKSREHVTDAGLIVAIEEPVCEWRRQRENEPPDGWCLARWTEPPPIQDWQTQFGGTFGYPKDGYWFSIASLKNGVEPSEEFCYLCADQIDFQRSLGFHKTLQLMMDNRERRDAKNKAEIGLMIDDCFVNHVPGARGGSYSAPSTKFN